MPSTASAVDLPFKEAVDFFRQKTDTPSAHWTAVMDEAHARSFAVAGATKDALIGDFRKAADKAIATGTSYGEFKNDFDSLVKKYGWSHTGTADWRARVIYNTNLSTAFAAGRYAQMTDPDVLAAFPYWQYLHINCPNPRLQHLAWSGMVLRADDPFWSTCYPPNGWGCHCIVVAVSERGLRRMGKSGPDTSPKLHWQEYINRKTGIVTKYPAGVDPGFVGNPGKAWMEGKQPPLKAPSMRPLDRPPPVLAPPGQNAVAPEVLQTFLQAPKGAVQVGALDARLAKALGAKTAPVLLSGDTMAKQFGELRGNPGHLDLSLADYAVLEDLIVHPELAFLHRGQNVMVVRRGDGIFIAAIKTTADARENYLVSFRRTNSTDLGRLLANSEILIGAKGDWTRR
jgi:hypothetical protein